MIYQSRWVILRLKWTNPCEPAAQLLAHSKHSLNCSYYYCFIKRPLAPRGEGHLKIWAWSWQTATSRCELLNGCDQCGLCHQVGPVALPLGGKY